MAVKEKVRIKLKGYEHATVDKAAEKISNVHGQNRNEKINKRKTKESQGGI